MPHNELKTSRTERRVEQRSSPQRNLGEASLAVIHAGAADPRCVAMPR